MDQHGYQRIADELRRQIINGDLSPGTRLPSRQDLAAHYQVAEGVAREAIRLLARDGLVITKGGSGTYVRERQETRILHRTWFRERRTGSPYMADLERQGVTGGYTYQSDAIQAPADVRGLLGLGDPDGRKPDVMRTVYVFTGDGEPWQLSTSYEPLDITEGTDAVFPERGPYAGLGVTHRMSAIGVQVDDWANDVSARIATNDEADLLTIPRGSVVLVENRSYMAGARVVEVATIVSAAEKTRLRFSGPVGEL